MAVARVELFKNETRQAIRLPSASQFQEVADALTAGRPVNSVIGGDVALFFELAAIISNGSGVFQRLVESSWLALFQLNDQSSPQHGGNRSWETGCSQGAEGRPVYHPPAVGIACKRHSLVISSNRPRTLPRSWRLATADVAKVLSLIDPSLFYLASTSMDGAAVEAIAQRLAASIRSSGMMVHPEAQVEFWRACLAQTTRRPSVSP